MSACPRLQCRPREARLNLVASPGKLPSRARQRVESSGVFASAASILEISIKSALGKLRANPAEVANLPHVHTDPFDRMLVAQALVENMILVTDDDALGGYGDCVEVV